MLQSSTLHHAVSKLCICALICRVQNHRPTYIRVLVCDFEPCGRRLKITDQHTSATPRVCVFSRSRVCWLLSFLNIPTVKASVRLNTESSLLLRSWPEWWNDLAWARTALLTEHAKVFLLRHMYTPCRLRCFTQSKITIYDLKVSTRNPVAVVSS